MKPPLQERHDPSASSRSLKQTGANREMLVCRPKRTPTHDDSLALPPAASRGALAPAAPLAVPCVA